MSAHGVPLAAGATVGGGRFAVTRVLGEGSQATTYEAVDKRDGKLVALKQFSVPRAKSWKDVELAEREAAVLSKLAHPLVPRYVTHFEEGGCLYLAMEKVEGEPLSALKAQGGLDQDAVLRFLEDAAETLDYLHGQSPPIIHRDIKPSNVLRRPDGRFTLVDFGSVQHRLRPEGGSTVVGTFGYMAPEQFQGRALPATDRYAVGATALALLTGLDPDQLPHEGLGIDVAKSLHGTTSSSLQRLLETLLEPDPDPRSRESLRELLTRHQLRSSPRSRSERQRDSEPSETSARPRSKRTHEGGKRRSKHERREARRRAREEYLHEWRHAHRGEPFQSRSARAWLSMPLALFTVLMALWAARVVASAVLLLVVPMILTLLSVAFGPGLRRGADAVRRAGYQTQRGLRYVAEKAREAANSDPLPPNESHDAHQRVRVVDTEGTQVDDYAKSTKQMERDVDDFEAEVEKMANELEERISRRFR